MLITIGYALRRIALRLCAGLLLSVCAALGGEALPRVLIVGDSVYNAPVQQVAKFLQGRVEVVFPEIQTGEVRSSAAVLKHLDQWLGDGKWDLIYFNAGLADLVHRAPGMKSFRVMPIDSGGILTTSPEHYEQNLRGCLERLKATGATLVWSNTTPVRNTANGIFERGAEVKYNAIAAALMVEHNVTVNDMHAYVTAHGDEPGAGEPFAFQVPLYVPMARSMLKGLKLTNATKGPVKVFIMVGGGTHTGGGIVSDALRPKVAAPLGTLDALVLNPETAARYQQLLDEKGHWATRPDVWVRSDRRGPKSGLLGIGFGGDRNRGIGPELTLGHVLGDHFEEQVYILKSTMGAPSLARELRPPGTGVTGAGYSRLLEQVNDFLAAAHNAFPDYPVESGYEISGLILSLGEQDIDAVKYAEYLPILINDLRKDLKTADLPVVIVGTGIGGRKEPAFPEIIAAQQGVAALAQFGGRVRYVETRDFWPSEDVQAAAGQSPYERWFFNAESFCQIGKVSGEAMLRLVK
ncbi:MAG: hypothetical protein ACI9OU_000802 [Candidatus Promineifilaceae bacterium]